MKKSVKLGIVFVPVAKFHDEPVEIRVGFGRRNIRNDSGQESFVLEGVGFLYFPKEFFFKPVSSDMIDKQQNSLASGLAGCKLVIDAVEMAETKL